MIAPHYKKVFDWIHENTAWKVMFHSDGSIYNLLPQFIEMGVDILNPVQCTAVNMEGTKDLRKSLAKIWCFGAPE